MKKVTYTIYEATDGRKFYSEAECLKYEKDGCVKLRAIPGYVKSIPICSDWRWMLSGDGDCLYATATHVSDQRARHADHPAWATHVVYFGK